MASSTSPLTNVGCSTTSSSLSSITSNHLDSQQSLQHSVSRPQEDFLRREVYFLIYKFLERSPLQESFGTLRRELQTKCLLPPQYDWVNGQERSDTTVDQVLSQYSHITADHLFQSLKQCYQALCEISPQPVKNSTMSFLSAGRFSLTRPIPKKSLIQQEETIYYKSNPYSLASMSNHIHHGPILPSRRFTSANFPGHICNTIFSRQLSGPKPIAHMYSIHFYERYQKYHRILGHLSSVFCVLFDRTGKYLITGADDALIKIWSATTGRLLASLRGHMGEITDLTVSMENDMLASGSCDRMIRVWNLRTTALITTLRAHDHQVSGVKFCPLMTSNTRYLVSISQDGRVSFFKYDAITRQINNEPIRFVERKRRDSQLVSCSFSAGGAFFAVGSTDAILYVYHVSAPSGPTKILEIEQHTDHVDSLQFSNHSMLKFISGGRDGLAHIWNYEKQKWHNLRIDINERLVDTPEVNEETTKKGGVRVCMVAWTIDDRYVITSQTDSSIKVWLAHNAKLKHILYGHEDDVFIIEPHPIDGRIILTGGHDGAIMIWDVVTGTNIKTFFNAIDGQGSGSLYDAKWNPDGTMFAVTDNYGHVLFFGLSSHNPYESLPDQMFFHTDYRPFIRDSNNFVIDEQMQIAPHLMPPPFLVDIEGNPYPPHLQRLVPGREHCLDSQLVPYVDQGQLQEQQNQQPPPGQRQTIDEMIEQLQRNVDNLANNQNQQQQPNNDNQITINQQRPQQRNVRDMAGQRRNGDIEGVRNSANFVSAGGGQMGIFMKKPLILPFSETELDSITKKQNEKTNAEEEYYNNERKKRPAMAESNVMDDSNQKTKPFTRRQKRINQQRRGVRCTLRNNEREVDEDLDDENDKDFTGATEESSSEEDDESDDSDWNHPSTSTSVVAIQGRKRKRRGSDVASDAEDNDEPRASTSRDHHNDVEHHSTRPRRSQVEERENRRAERRKRLEQIKMDRYERRFRQVDTLDERFRPPDWFTNSKPKKTPYFPQIGDKVVYFRQGHQNYIDAIRQTKCYNISSTIKPFKLRGSEADEIFAKIVGIQFQVKPPRLVILKMVVIDPQAEDNDDEIGSGSGQQQQSSSILSPPLGHQQQFSVRYHDLDHVCDFIILKQMYDSSIARDWRVNDMFRSVIDDKWWVGKIHSIQYNEENTYFQTIEVVWNNGDKEWLSPWDLEPLPSNSIERPSPGPSTSTAVENYNDGVPVSDDERVSFTMIDEQGWPGGQREQQRQRLINGLIRIMQMSYAEDFSVPVDLNQHPIYAMIIPYPMDLSTIMARLENNFYRRIEAVKFDARFIESNASLYNVPESEIVKKAKIITECVLRFIDDPDCVDPMPIYNNVTENYNARNNHSSSSAMNTSGEQSAATTSTLERPRRSTRRVRVVFSDSDMDDVSPTRQPTTATSGFNRRSTIRTRAYQEQMEQQPQPRSWKQLCRELIDYIFDLQDSEPFRASVDPIQYPNYLHVIDTPMDLTTVKEQLLADVYESPGDFCKDMRLIFTNSKMYNTNKKSRIYSMTVRLSALFEEKMRKVMSELKSSRVRNYRRGTGTTSAIQPTSSYSRRVRNRPGGGSRLLSPPMSPNSADEQQSHRPRRALSSTISIANDVHHPSSSSSSMNNHREPRTSHRIAHQTSSSMEKYGLRHRTKRIRTYKEDSDDDQDDYESGSEPNSDELDNRTTNGTMNHNETNYHLRNKQLKLPKALLRSSDDDEDNEMEQEDKTIQGDETDEKTEDEKTEDDKTDFDEEEEEDESEEDEEEEDEEETQLNDSDATQVDGNNNNHRNQHDDNKENRTRSTNPTGNRPVRSARVRKPVHYGEDDDDDSDFNVQKSNRIRNVHPRPNKRLRRNSFSESINESSRESIMSSSDPSSSAASTNAINAIIDDDTDNEECGEDSVNAPAVSSLRRSQRKIRPKRRFSSEDSEEDIRFHRQQRQGRTLRNYYDNSDLYSAVKTRQRSGSTSGGSHHHHRSSSTRQTTRINYNEDDLDHRLYSTVSGTATVDHHSTSRFPNGSTNNRGPALIGR